MSTVINTYNSGSGTETAPTGAVAVTIDYWGGGAGGRGGGSNSSANNSPGGGSGAKGQLVISSGILAGESVSYSVGVNGVGGASPFGAATNGTASTVTGTLAGVLRTLSAGGGSGPAAGGNTAGGSGGTATGGTTNTSGGTGEAGSGTKAGDGGDAPSGGTGGAGQNTGSSTAAGDGTAPSAGGAGGCGTTNAAARIGGDGADGRITFTWTIDEALAAETIMEDGSNDEIITLWATASFDDNYIRDVSSVSAVRDDLPEDFVLGLAFPEFADPPNDTDWNDWSWAQAPPIDDFPEDFILGIDDGTNLEDPAYTDWFPYGSQTDPLSDNIIDLAQLPFVEDASRYDDPSFTDFFPYETQTDPLSDDAEPPIDVVKDGTNELDDPSLTDWFDYGTQTDPLSEDIGGDPLPSSIDDGTNLAEYADLEDYSTQTDPTPDDVEEQPIAQVWDGTTEWDDPSLVDFFPYGTEVEPLSDEAPPSPLANGGDDASEYEDPSFTDFMDYGSVVPPSIPPAPPIPPVVPTGEPCLRLYVNENVPVTACNLNTFAQTCNVISELRALIGQAGVQVLVRGAYAVGDGGGGVYIWSPTQIGGDDGAGIIFPDGGASTGAWVRVGYLSHDNQFLPITAAPAANSDGGYVYVSSDGVLRYRGPTSDSTLAPA